MEKRQPGYRADIDGLRAVAIIPVVLFHAGLGLPGGFVGVDVFFVISGFLITRIIYGEMLAGSFSYRDFYDRRARRLLPPLIVMLIATAVWAVLTLTWFDLISFGKSLVSTAIYASNVNFYRETGYFIEGAHTKPLLHTWSLAVEEQFYIAVPFLLFGLLRIVPRRFHLPAWGLLSGASFLVCVWQTKDDTGAAFYLLPARAWELGLGGVLALAMGGSKERLHDRAFLAGSLCLAGLCAILSACIFLNAESLFPGWLAAIPALGSAAVLMSGDVPGTPGHRLLTLAPMTFVGRISYSLYLWHWPVIVAMSYGREALSGWSAVAAVGISVTLATFSWRYVERPFRQRAVLAKSVPMLAGAVAASLIMGAAGLALYRSNGFPGRFSGGEKLAAMVAKDSQKGPRIICHSRTAEQIRTGDLCRLGRTPGPVSFVLFGDSHAEALSPAVNEAALLAGLSGVQITNPGLISLPGRRSAISDPNAEILPAFIDRLHRSPEIGTILITGFWAWNATGRSYRKSGQLFTDDRYDGSGMAYNPKAFAHGLDRLVKTFPHRQFLILDDVPSGTGLDLRDHARSMVVSGQAKLGLPRTEADRQHATYHAILVNLAKNNRNVRYAPVMTDAVCDQAVCRLFSPSGKAVFRDGDHLAPTFAKSLAPRLLPLLRSSGSAQ